MGSAKKVSVKSSDSHSRGAAKKSSPARRESTKTLHTSAHRGDHLQSTERSEFYRPRKELITLRVDADVLTSFRKTGDGYQATMNKFLKTAMVEALMREGSGGVAGDPFQGSSPALTDSTFFKPKKVQMSLRLDSDVVGWYKGKGKGYQTVMNRYLRLAMLELTHSEGRIRRTSSVEASCW
jgi:uncharacterized protein (DUF4415 family)